MPTITNLKGLGKRERQRILTENPGLLSRIAKTSGVTVATVSRVFSGDIKRSPTIEAAIIREIEKLEAA